MKSVLHLKNHRRNLVLWRLRSSSQRWGREPFSKESCLRGPDRSSAMRSWFLEDEFWELCPGAASVQPLMAWRGAPPADAPPLRSLSSPHTLHSYNARKRKWKVRTRLTTKDHRQMSKHVTCLSADSRRFMFLLVLISQLRRAFSVFMLGKDTEFTEKFHFVSMIAGQFQSSLS